MTATTNNARLISRARRIMEFMASTIDPQAINLPMKIGIPCKNRIEIAAAQRDPTKSCVRLLGEQQRGVHR
jgi:hypothetical protein